MRISMLYTYFDKQNQEQITSIFPAPVASGWLIQGPNTSTKVHQETPHVHRYRTLSQPLR